MKILFISYSFPPIGGSGVVRSLKHIKYLPQYGITPIILTCNPKTSKIPLDYSRMVDVNPNIKVYHADDNSTYPSWVKGHRAKIIYSSLFHFPDDRVGWADNAIKIGGEIIESENIDLIYSSSPPISAHSVAMALKMKYNIPWVSDYRDAWASVKNETYFISPYHYRKAKKYKSQLLSATNHVIHINMWYINKLRMFYPNHFNGNYSIIPNGYDESDFKNYISRKTPTNNTLIISYTGTINRYRSPKSLIIAVTKVLKKNPLFRIKVQFYTGRRKLLQKIIRKYAGASENSFKCYDLINFRDVLKVWQLSDVLLLLIKPKGGEGVFTGKLFEYLRANRTILGLVPPGGEASKILRQYGHKHICSINDINQIVPQIEMIYSKWEKKKLSVNESIDASEYSREHLAMKLAIIMKATIE